MSTLAHRILSRAAQKAKYGIHEVESDYVCDVPDARHSEEEQRHAATRVLNTLARRGKLEKIGRGKFRLPTQ